jgi:hypothetical protein
LHRKLGVSSLERDILYNTLVYALSVV